MRPIRRLLPLLLSLTAPALGRGQAVPRADTPKRWTVRLTLDPTIAIWQDQFISDARRPLGAAVTGDSVGAVQLPLLARLEQQVALAGDTNTFRANLGHALLGARAERRTTALGLEVGITDRLSIGASVPLVRVNVRAHFALDTTGSNLGANPRITTPDADTAYDAFFTQFDAALTALDGNIAAGGYGCPGSAQCAQAQALSASGHAVRDALRQAAAGPLLPVAGSSGATAIDSNIARIQQELSANFGVVAFTHAFLSPANQLTEGAFAAVLQDSVVGFGASPFTDTRRSARFWAGDAEVQTRYRLIARPGYAATIGFLIRLPTGHQDSPHNFLDLSTGDHQTDLEGQLTQELVVAHRLWLNLAIRAGQQRPGERERRVMADGGAAFLVPRAAWAKLAWDPGDYVAVNFAPLYRFTPSFAGGFTVGYYGQGSDRYTFRSAQDSLDLAARLGAPTSAAVLDGQTAARQLRVGGAITYAGPRYETGVSVETAISGTGWIPAATVFRIVLRTSRPLF